MTKRSGILEREVIKSSVMPSLKYSCSRSPLMLVNGNTAIEGLSGKVSAGLGGGGIDSCVCGGLSETGCTRKIVPTVIATPESEKTARRGDRRRTVKRFTS